MSSASPPHHIDPMIVSPHPQELTGHKALKKGVILEATVSLGRIHTLESGGDRTMTLSQLRSLAGGPFDSVCIARAVSSGHEYVVYDPKQVLSIERAR